MTKGIIEASIDTPSEERRAVLAAIAKYTTVTVGAGMIALSSADAVRAQANSNACANNSNAAGCQ